LLSDRVRRRRRPPRTGRPRPRAAKSLTAP
jgi:hypothetical protein